LKNLSLFRSWSFRFGSENSIFGLIFGSDSSQCGLFSSLCRRIHSPGGYVQLLIFHSCVTARPSSCSAEIALGLAPSFSSTSAPPSGSSSLTLRVRAAVRSVRLECARVCFSWFSPEAHRRAPSMLPNFFRQPSSRSFGFGFQRRFRPQVRCPAPSFSAAAGLGILVLPATATAIRFRFSSASARVPRRRVLIVFTSRRVSLGSSLESRPFFHREQHRRWILHR
jgi:hypothetical protein